MSDVDMQNLTQEELLARYAAGERDFSGVILQRVSLDGVSLNGVSLNGAIFNKVTFRSVRVDPQDIYKGRIYSTFVNCNFSCSEWWFCRIPKFVGCNIQYAVFEGCYFRGISIDSDWRNSQTMSPYHDDFIYERCDLRGRRKSSGGIHLGPEIYGDPGFGVLYRNSFDPDGVFRSGIHCDLPVFHKDDIPF